MSRLYPSSAPAVKCEFGSATPSGPSFETSIKGFSLPARLLQLLLEPDLESDQVSPLFVRNP